jgi:hypothetical protein
MYIERILQFFNWLKKQRQHLTIISVTLLMPIDCKIQSLLKKVYKHELWPNFKTSKLGCDKFWFIENRLNSPYFEFKLTKNFNMFQKPEEKT